MGIQDRITLDTYVKLNQGEKLAERMELFLQGRAARQLRALYPTFPAQAFFGEPCRPPFLRDWHNHFDNYGNFVAGYCGGISLGHWKDLEELISVGIDLNEHPVLRFLVAEDVKGLLDFARDLGYREAPGGYLSKCDLCLDLREYLVSRGNFTELSPKEFYTYLG